MTSTSWSRIVDSEHPWLGLASFDETTHEWFYGRDPEIRDLFRRVREHPLTLLFGRSGLGKTSLLRAGLVPKLRVEGYRPVLIRMRFDDAALPLIDQVHAAIDRTLGPKSTSTGTLWERFHHLPTRPEHLGSSPLVMVFDQFEEVFTLATNSRRQEEQARLATELADLVEHRPPELVRDRLLIDRSLAREYDFSPTPIRVTIALREDYLWLIEGWKKRMPAVMRNRMQIHELDGPQALEAVFKPGRQAGRDLVDYDVAGQIVRFVADRPADTPLAEIAAVPPLLSLVCDELNQARIEANLPAITADLVAHQSRDILDNFYERAFEQIPEAPVSETNGSESPADAGLTRSIREAVRRFIEDRLVTVSGHRTQVAREDAVEALTRAGVPDAAAALDHLVQGRLLTTEERDGLQRLEITHDVLADLVVRSREDRRERERARRAELALAMQRVTSRRQRLLIATFGTLAIASIVGSGVAWWQAREADAAREIAEQSRQQLDEALRSSALLLRQASTQDFVAGRQLVVDPSTTGGLPETQNITLAVMQPDGTLRREVRATPTLQDPALEISLAGSLGTREWRRGIAFLIRAMTWADNQSAVDTAFREVATFLEQNGLRLPLGPPLGHERGTLVRFAPSGKQLATAGGGWVRFWDPATGKPDGDPLRVEGVITTVAFSPDGRLIAVGGDKGKVFLFDVSNRKAVGEPLEHRDWWISSLAFSPTDGSLAVAAGPEVRFWEVNSGEPAGKPIAAPSTACLAFAPDGTWLATVGNDGSLRVWSLATRQLLTGPAVQQFSAESSSTKDRSGVLVTSDGELILANLNGKFRFWQRNHSRESHESHEWVPTLTTTDVTAVAVSPDGLLGLFGGPGCLAHISQLHFAAQKPRLGERMPRSTPFAHDLPVMDVAWSPAGDRIATLCSDGTVRLWSPNLRCPPAPAPLPAPSGAVSQISVPGKGQSGTRPAVTADADSTTREWITAVSGSSFADAGHEMTVPESVRQERLLSAPPRQPGWAELADWLREQGPDRHVRPFHQETVRQRALMERVNGRSDVPPQILEYDPECPCLRLRLANLLSPSSVRLAAFLRGYEIKRLPNDPTELALAARFLLDQPGGVVERGPEKATCRKVALELIERADLLLSATGKQRPREFTVIRANALAEADRWEEASDLFRALAHGMNPASSPDLVLALMANGDDDEAREAWAMLAERATPTSPPAMFMDVAKTGLLLSDMTQPDLARMLQWGRDVQENFSRPDQPPLPPLLEVLGVAELRNGEAAKAVAMLERARSMVPKASQWTVLHLALARARMGDGLAARQMLTDVMPATGLAWMNWRERLVWNRLWPEAEQAASEAPAPKILTNSVGMNLVRIEPGTFLMGADQGEADERPAHEVRMSRPFFLGQTEVTQAQWVKVMGTKPWADLPDVSEGPNYPATGASSEQAMEFCRKLTELERQAGRVPEAVQYRLPTEAEWEYACRAGTVTRFSFGNAFGNDESCIQDFAWFHDNHPTTAAPGPKEVALKKPNPWGLYDMHGNANEWCSDWYASDYYQFSPEDDPTGPPRGLKRVVRGGHWRDTNIKKLESSNRKYMRPNDSYGDLGFRVVLESETSIP